MNLEHKCVSFDLAKVMKFGQDEFWLAEELGNVKDLGFDWSGDFMGENGFWSRWVAMAWGKVFAIAFSDVIQLSFFLFW